MSSESESEGHHSKSKHKRTQRKDDWKSMDILEKEISKVLRSFEGDHRELISRRYDTKLNLKIIEKKPCYVADQKTCMQAVLKSEPKIDLKPFNEINTQFYGAHPKPHVIFNCHDEAVEGETPRFPPVSHPAFHYKNYEQFKERRKSSQVLESCERITVRSWSVAIVNISRRGYYGPVLVIHDFQRVPENILLEKPVQNILFCEQVSGILDEFRIRDIKKLNIQVEYNRFNFPYYIRNHTTVTKNSKLSQFVNLDTKNSLLFTNQNLPISFVPLGKLSESQMFKRFVHTKYLYNRKKINLNNFNFEASLNDERMSESSSSSSFIQEDPEAPPEINQQKDEPNINESMGNMVDENQENQDSVDQESEDDDYLKKIYQKAMQNEHFL